MEIVRLRPGDCDQLGVFFNKINTPDIIKNFSPHPFSREEAERVCNYKGDDRYYGVRLDDEKIIGYAMLRGWDEGYEIPSIGLCVLKEYQGAGLGRLIMNFLLTESGLRGCHKVMLKVRKDNVAAKRLYEDFDFSFEEYNADFLLGYKVITAPPFRVKNPGGREG